jgi:catechol 2,3-dioxygenase-like lactoylglutathione lyase family enzyme
MIDHLTLGSHDLDAATRFYTACLETLGVKLHEKNDKHAAFGIGEAWSFFVYPSAPGSVLNGDRQHVAFSAPSAEAVQAFYDTALRMGATSLTPPGGLPHISERYYGAMCRDLDQHALEVVYWKSA